MMDETETADDDHDDDDDSRGSSSSTRETLYESGVEPAVNSPGRNALRRWRGNCP